jgi:hypothetical protein
MRTSDGIGTARAPIEPISVVRIGALRRILRVAWKLCGNMIDFE